MRQGFHRLKPSGRQFIPRPRAEREEMREMLRPHTYYEEEKTRTMHYFYDSEFIDDGKTIDLISIGIACEDGRTYYAQSVDFNHRNVSEWVKENVMKQLPMCPWAKPAKWGIPGLYRADKTYHKRFGQCVDQHRGIVHNCPWRTRVQIRHEILSFLNPERHGNPELWGWITSYDYVSFCQLFGTMMDLPNGYPHYIKDIQYLLDERGISDDQLPQQQEGLHNALADAQHLKKLWEYLTRNDKLYIFDEADLG